MADFKTFTSEEALDDYFSSLLDEEAIELEHDAEDSIMPEPEPEPEPELEPELELEPEPEPEPIYWYSESVTVNTPEPQYQPQFSPVEDDNDVYPFELPQLEDVQRLLSQLENAQLEAQVEIDALIYNDVLVDTTGVESAIEKAETETQDVLVASSNIESDLIIKEEAEEKLDLSAWDISDKVKISSSSELQIGEVEPIVDNESEEATETQLKTQAGKAPPPSGLDWENAEHQEEFQVLFFEVMGVMFAVPLAELGGIHQITELSHLIGRPDWYLGLQTNREIKIDALDTAKWVMPQSIKDENYKEDYQYLVMLGESKWGLACNVLAGTETLTSDRIRWRKTAGKRPWLSGMVKEKMCALIHVEAMITMLNAGLDIKGIE